MTATITQPAEPAEPAVAGKPPRSRRTFSLWDVLLDASVLLLASWTVVYHVCLLARFTVRTAVLLEILCLLAWSALRGRLYLQDRRARGAAGVPPDDALPADPLPAVPLLVDAGASDGGSAHPTAAHARTRRLLGIVLVAISVTTAVAAAILMAVSAPWPPTALLWLVAAAGSVGWGWLYLGVRQPRTIDPAEAAERAPGWVSSLLAFGWGVGLAVLSLFMLRPSPDDLFYVNLSQWVVEHGTFPLRDTIFADQVYPMTSWPPTASYDALVGVVGRLLGLQAGQVVYLLVPPAMAFLSVLALWRLLRTWRIRYVPVALSISLVFLLMNGAKGYESVGNLFVGRLWQGKVILLCLLIPLLLVYAVRYCERPTRGRAGWLFLGGVAAVALSTSALFLVPLIAIAGAIPLALRRQYRHALTGFAAMAVYPIGGDIVTILVHGHSADDFGIRKLYRFDPEWFGHQIFLTGVLALIVVAAVLIGAFLIPHRDARLMTGLLTLVVGITFIPGFTTITYRLLGLGPTLWRVSWVASIAALVGVAGAALARYVRPRAVGWLLPVGLAVALVAVGIPIWSRENNTYLSPPLHWQLGSASYAAADLAISHAEQGDIVLAPQPIMIAIDVKTTRVKTVAPRAYFLYYLRHIPSLHYQDRITLIQFINRSPTARYGWPKAKVAAALKTVDVAEVCLPNWATARQRYMTEQGYTSIASKTGYFCMVRSS